jgi:hypothetical protein
VIDLAKPLVKIEFRENANVEPVRVAAADDYRQKIPQAIQLRIFPLTAARQIILKIL